MGTRVRIVGEGGGGPPPDMEAPMVIAVNDFGPHQIDRDYNFRSSGILIDRSSTWDAGTLEINLNGRTLTYGKGETSQESIRTYAGTRSGPNIGHAGILCPQFGNQNKEFFDSTDPDSLFEFNTTNNLIIQINGPGMIRSGGGAGLQFSDAILLSGIPVVNVDNVTIQVYCLDSCGIRFRDGDIGRNSVFIQRGPVDNRGQIPAAIREDDNASPPTRVHDNTILESLHAGIRADGDMEVGNNNITVNAASETNMFGIVAYNATGGNWHDNVIRGDDNARGIGIGGSGVSTTGNDIDVQGLTDAFLTHGLQVEGATSFTARGETVVARASPNNTCDALNLKDIASSAVIDIQDSTFRAFTSGDKYGSAVLIYSRVEGDPTDGTNSIISGNTFISDKFLIGCEFNGLAQNWTFKACTFELIGGGATFWVCEQGFACSGFVLLDCTFVNCNPRDMQNTADVGGFNGVADLDGQVRWTTTLSGTPDAAYTCVDANAVTQATGTLDGGGSAVVPLPEVSLKWDGTLSGSDRSDHTEHNDYEITINGKPQTVTVDRVQTVTEPA